MKMRLVAYHLVGKVGAGYETGWVYRRVRKREGEAPYILDKLEPCGDALRLHTIGLNVPPSNMTPYEEDRPRHGPALKVGESR